MEILIIRVSAIGDVIHTLPAIFYLKRTIPSAQITWVVQEKAASIIKNQPFIKHLYVLPNSFLRPKNWKKTIATISELKKTKWDAIIDFQGLTKTSLIIAPLIGKKFGFNKEETREQISTLFTHHKTTPQYTNIIQKNLSLASHTAHTLGLIDSSPSINNLKKDFTLFTPEEKKDVVDEWFAGVNGNTIVALAPNTTWASKHWPLEHWQGLITLLVREKIETVLVGKEFGNQAKALALYIEENHLPIRILPKWDLLTMAYFMQSISLLIAPDTGLLHLADFLQTRTIGIFGPTLASKHGPFLTAENQRAAIQIQCPHCYAKNHGPVDCMKRLGERELFKYILRELYS